MEFEILVPSLLVAFVTTVALMLALHPIAHRIGLVDQPGGRKQHDGAVPIIGGLAMFVGIVSGIVVLGTLNEALLGLVTASILLVGIGVLDDKFQISSLPRMAVQLAAILIMTNSLDLSLSSLGDPFGFGEILLGPFSLIMTIMVAITVINAYNLVDGVDGLAGILTLIALFAVGVVGGPGVLSTHVAFIVALSVIGFLIFNFPVIANRPIRSFMGDAGSTLLGFIVFWVTLGISQGDEAIISPVLGLWFASIPVYDSLTCFVRRIAAGKSPFTPGRDHFHHTLRRGGYGVRQKLAILGGLQASYALMAIGGHYAGVPDVVMFTAWSALGLSQRWVIKAISKRYRLYLFQMLRSGQLGPYRTARARSLR